LASNPQSLPLPQAGSGGLTVGRPSGKHEKNQPIRAYVQKTRRGEEPLGGRVDYERSRGMRASGERGCANRIKTGGERIVSRGFGE